MTPEKVWCIALGAGAVASAFVSFFALFGYSDKPRLARWFIPWFILSVALAAGFFAEAQR